MERILKTLWFTPGLGGRWGLPAIFRGAPGIAKSAIIDRVVRECGFHLETVLASLRQPEDFLGLPIPVKDEADRQMVVSWMREQVPNARELDVGPNVVAFSVTTYSPPAWAVKAWLAERAVVFFDEINSAPPAVQAALLRVVLDGVVGELELPHGVRFVAAMNPTEEAAGGWDLAPPLANRFGHFDWPLPAVQSWIGYMAAGARNDIGERGDPEKEEKAVLGAWPEHFAKSAGAMSGFLTARPEMFHKQPAAGDPKASGAWPSPRSIEMAARALGASRLRGLSEKEQDDCVAGFVGEGFAAEFSTYRRKADLPNPEDVLDGRVQWKHDPIRLDRTAAVFASCSHLVISSADRKRERAGALWKLLGTVVGEAGDLCIPAAESLSKAQLGLSVPEAQPVLGRLFPIADAAGVNRKRR